MVTEEPILVFFETEISDYNSRSELLHIYMKCGASKFNKYINPTTEISENMSKHTHLTVRDSKLYRDGMEKVTWPLRIILEDLLVFLNQFGQQCILITHGYCYVKFSRLTRLMREEKLEMRFKEIVAGFTDSLDLFSNVFPGIEPKKLTVQKLAWETCITSERLYKKPTGIKDCTDLLEQISLHYFTPAELAATKRIVKVIEQLKKLEYDANWKVVNKFELKLTTEEPILVFFATENSDFKDYEILHIYMKCGASKFNKYIKPTKKIAEKMSEYTHLTIRGSKLYRDGVEKIIWPLRIVLIDLLVFLEQFGRRCTLISHRRCYTDLIHLTRAMKKHNLVMRFCKVIAGFTDSLHLFSNKFPGVEPKVLTVIKLAKDAGVTRETPAYSMVRTMKDRTDLLEKLSLHCFASAQLAGKRNIGEVIEKVKRIEFHKKYHHGGRPEKILRERKLKRMLIDLIDITDEYDEYDKVDEHDPRT